MLRRHYNGQAGERRRIDTPEDIPFLHGFPTQTKENKGSLPEIVPKHELHPGAAKAEDRGGPEVDHVKEQEILEDAVDIRETPLPKSNEETEAIFDENRNEIGIDFDSSHDPEAAVINLSDSSSDIATNGNEVPVYGLEDPAEYPVDEDQSALRSVPKSREETIQPEENEKWVPLAERENIGDEQVNFNEQLQQALAVDQHTELALETELPAIHILGTGPTGKYIAHALAGLPEAPAVTLLMHQPLSIQQWHDEGAKITLLKDGKISTKSNFNIESSSYIQRDSPDQRFPGFGKNLEHTAEPPKTPIDCLLVTTEGHISVAALSAIKHRLKPSSTICFIQDGLGVTDLVNSSVFPNPNTRPSYVLGNISHDLVPTQKKFTLFEKSPGRISLTMTSRNLSATELRRGSNKDSPLIRRMGSAWTPMSTFLMRTLIRAPDLGVVGLAPPKFYEMQLQKLAVNAVIGPLSVLYDCYNSELLSNYNVSRSMMMLINEISTILQRLPGVSRQAKIEKCFSAEKLEAIIVGVLGKTGKNSTSMLQAVRRGERTDIDFYNGYLLNRAAELRIHCPHLEMMVAMVKGKQAMTSKERNSFIPFKA